PGARVAGAHPGVVDAAGRTSFGELATLLEAAAVVVVGNTGPAHLAAAVGTPVASWFSAVMPVERWVPFGVPVVLLGDLSAPCRLTRAQVCPVPGHPCLDVPPQDVVDAVEALAAGRVPAPPPAVPQNAGSTGPAGAEQGL
ncbi:glycosyltransferase family 9 protein, partial [Kineococcus sp. R8]|uniref:glycosyltransferase family 9 protein n=1 Tax=Kineococcus siccus TaxID=2696567 RepID=UPI001412207E